MEDAAAAWALDLLGLPAGADVGFVTGATMANFTGLAAARQQVLADAGWDVGRDGLAGGPRVRVLVGAERHETLDLALRYLGLGAPTAVAADDQGRLVVADLERALAEGSGPTIVCLQAGNLHSGAFDPMAEAIDVAHRHGAWVHVDGAFGLWAAASPRLRQPRRRLRARRLVGHRRAQDPQRAVRLRPGDRRAPRAAAPRPRHARRVLRDVQRVGRPAGEGARAVPARPRRARVGRAAVARAAAASRTWWTAWWRTPGRSRTGSPTIDGAEILNDVVFTQVCVAFGSDERTRAVTARVLADGVTWMSGSRWQGRDVLRVSVSNWSTDAEDVARSVDAVRRAASTD